MTHRANLSARGRLTAGAIRLLLLALGTFATAQTVSAQELAIVGGTVHPVSGPAIEGGTVLVRDGRIVAVGRDVAVPADARRIDATGKVVTPGLFAPTGSLGLVEVDQVGDTDDASFARGDDIVTAAFDVVDGLNPFSTLLPYNRLGGVTTAVAAPSGGLIAGQAAVIALSGDSPTAMLVRPRVAMFASFGEEGARAAGGARGAAALRLREVFEDARYWRSNRAAFDRGETRELAASRLDLEALQPVLAGTMPLVVEAHRASDILAVLRIAREYGARPVILGGTEAWMVASELAAVGVPVILKPLTSLPAAFERLGARFDNAAILAAARVPIALSAFETHRASSIAQEAGNAVRYGLPWEAALRAVTLAPAEIYGVAERTGSLEVGKSADLVVWSGDPFELSTRAEVVIIGGEVMPEWSRQRELFERYRTLDPARPPAYP